MKTEEMNAISTAIIAYATIIGLIIGLYYNMKLLNISIIYIILLELMLLFLLGMFVLWLQNKVKNA